MKTIYLPTKVSLTMGLLFLAGETALAAPPKAPIAGCAPPKAKYDFHVNQVRAVLKNHGANFLDSTGLGAYKVGDDPRNTITVTGLWMGGMMGAMLRTAGQTYYGGNSDEYWPGPLDASGTISVEKCNEYDRHFFVSKKEVEAFKNGGTLTNGIKEWPGNSTVNGRKLAPFVDKDNDNMYDPSKGDYPLMKGDGMSWTIYNDAGNTHQFYNGTPIGMEIQQSTFAFDNPYIHLNQTTFQHYKMSYLGSSNLDSFFVGLFTDFQLGYEADNYIGCDPSNQMWFAYNGDNFDETARGFGAIVPATGFRILEGIEDANQSNVRMSRFMHFGNTPSTSSPSSNFELYRCLTGSFKSGIRWTYGGNGYNPSSTDYANFAFPGTKDPQARPEWSEKTENNASGLRTGMASMGPIKLVPGAVFDFTIAIPFAQEGNADQSLDSLISIGEQQQAFFDNNFQMEENKWMVFWKNSTESSYVNETRHMTIILNKAPQHDVEVSIIPDAASGTMPTDAELSASSVIFKAGELPEQTITIRPIKNPNKGYTVLRYKLQFKSAINGYRNGQNVLSYGVLAKEEPIAQVNVSDANGIPSRLGEYVAVRGLLYCHGLEVIDPNAFGPYAVLSVADGSKGIGLLLKKTISIEDYAITAPKWDQTTGYMDIWVYGKVAQIHGMTVIEPEAFEIYPNKSAKEVKVITKVTEAHESDFIVFKNCSIVDSAEWTSAASRRNGVRFTNGTDTVKVVIPGSTAISAKVPLQNVDIYGTGYQKDETSPFADNYSLRVTHEKFIVPHGKPVSVKELQAAGTLEVFPNPVTDAFFIRSNDARIQSIEIFDLQGKKVFEQSGLNTLEAHVNVEQALSKGIYLLSIQQDGNKRSIRKVMVQE